MTATQGIIHLRTTAPMSKPRALTLSIVVLALATGFVVLAWLGTLLHAAPTGGTSIRWTPYDWSGSSRAAVESPDDDPYPALRQN